MFMLSMGIINFNDFSNLLLITTIWGGMSGKKTASYMTHN